MCPLVAREAELRTLLECWRTSRLVTLFGQSGVGKSALAQAAAAVLVAERRDQVRSVDASGARSGAALLRLLARERRRVAQGVPASRPTLGQTPTERAAEAESAPPTVFILLDDLPVSAHVAARGVLQWLVAHPQAHLLVVSRWPLELLGEQVLPLRPFAGTSVGEASSPAAAFFEHYARRARPGGPAPDPALIGALCRVLDGLPAALEAAAGLLGALPDDEIARIARAEPLSLALRGRGLEAFVAATWDDLPPAARAYLAALAIGPNLGGGAGPPVTGSTAGAAARLLQIGVLRIAATHPRPRYRLSPLLAAWVTGERGGGACGRRGDGETRGSDNFMEADRADLDLAGRPVSPSSFRPLALSPPRPLAPGPLLIRLLGPFTVEGPGGTLAAARLRPKEQRILARLALEPGQVVSRDELLELFWSQSPARAAERSLRTVVSSLRAALRPVLAGRKVRVISGRLEGYCLEAEACAVDADLFARAIRAARGATLESPPHDTAPADWRQAYEWYRGDLLGAFRYEDWCLTARERLRDDFLEALFRLARAALAAGSPEAARSLAARMVEIDATEERAHRLLMRCYALLARPGKALCQFERCRAALRSELGAGPAAATVSLFETIRAGGALFDLETEEPDRAADARGALFR